MINAKIIDQDTTGVPGGFCCKNPVDQYMTGAKNPAVLIVDQDTTGVPRSQPRKVSADQSEFSVLSFKTQNKCRDSHFRSHFS